MTEIEPLIRSELERLVPLPRASRLNWDDVVDRAGRGRRRRLVRSRRTVVVAIALALLTGAGVALAASALFGSDPLTGPPAPADNDAALRALFPPYRIGHATQLAEYEGRKLFGARTANGGYCFSATSPIDPKGEGGHCVSPSESRTLDAGGTVAFAMSGGSVGGYAPGASRVHISGAGIDVTVPVLESGWWLGIAGLPTKRRPPFHGAVDVVATSLSSNGRVLGRDPLMRVSVLRPADGWVFGIAFN
jgi:hypothetical protein